MSIRYARVVAESPKPVDEAPTPAPAIWRIAIEVLLVIAIGFTVFVGYGLVDNRWYHLVAIQGSSMAPTLMPGDLILITRPPETVEEGMVLTLQVDGVLVTHRVSEVRSDGSFRTRGDANTVTDDFSANQVQIVGQYQFRIPWLGGILSPDSGAFFTQRAAVPGGATTWVDTVSTADGALKPISSGAGDSGVASTAAPTSMSAAPSAQPTQAPTATPSAEPTATPSATPTQEPTPTPSATPTQEPTATPSAEPTADDVTPAPTASAPEG